MVTRIEMEAAVEKMGKAVSRRLTDQIIIQTGELKEEINATLGDKLDEHTTDIALVKQEQVTQGREIGELKKSTRGKRIIDYAKFSALGSLLGGAAYGFFKFFDK